MTLKLFFLIPVLSLFIIANTYGKSGQDLANPAAEEQMHRQKILNYINSSDMFSSIAKNYSPDELVKAKQQTTQYLQQLNTSQLEDVAKEIVNNGDPFGTISSTKNEEKKPPRDAFNLINTK